MLMQFTLGDLLSLIVTVASAIGVAWSIRITIKNNSSTNTKIKNAEVGGDIVGRDKIG